MPTASGEILVIMVLILLNGFFSGAEIAILTARRGRLSLLAQKGDRAAQRALDLAADADRFLPTVQVGITLVGTLAAAFGGASLVDHLKGVLVESSLELVSRNSGAISLSIVVVGIAFASLIFGELVPKRVALQHAEPLARVVAFPMYWLQRMTQPMIGLLQLTTRAVLYVLGQKTDRQSNVSVEDIQHLIDAGTEAGLFEHSEKQVASEALRLGDRTLVDILRPRVEIDAIDIDTPADEVIGAIAMSGFSRVPVCEGNIDHIIGFVYIKDVFLQQHLGRPIDLRRLTRPALFVPKSLTITRLLELFQEHRTQLAIVLDEYGGTEGMVTLDNVLETLIGSIHDEHRVDHSQDIVVRDDGSLLVDAAVTLRELQKKLMIDHWSEPTPRDVGTVTGLVHGVLRRPPRVGDRFAWSGLQIEVVDMDGPRIDRLLITKQA